MNTIHNLTLFMAGLVIGFAIAEIVIRSRLKKMKYTIMRMGCDTCSGFAYRTADCDYCKDKA